MSLPPPSFDEDYQLTASHEASLEVFNGMLGDIAGRLRNLQSVVVAYEEIEAEGVSGALEAIAETIAPQIAALTGAVTALQSQITTASGQLTAIQAGGVVAANVAVSNTVGLGVNLDVNEAFAAVKALIEGIETSLEADVAALIARRHVVDTVAANANLAVDRSYRITSATAVTLTLPASPTTGATIRIADSGTITRSVQHTVLRNGKQIMGLAEDLLLDAPGIDLTLFYNGTEWRLH